MNRPYPEGQGRFAEVSRASGELRVFDSRYGWSKGRSGLRNSARERLTQRGQCLEGSVDLIVLPRQNRDGEHCAHRNEADGKEGKEEVDRYGSHDVVSPGRSQQTT